eukprot:SAG31_NODE_19118_length_611_cov_11.552734_1_plen_51_part_10
MWYGHRWKRVHDVVRPQVGVAIHDVVRPHVRRKKLQIPAMGATWATVTILA